jgi:hypothetical protein
VAVSKDGMQHGCVIPSTKPLELRRPENVVLQQMEQDDMASETRRDQSPAPERETPKDWRSSARPPAQSGPRIVSDGPELPRSNLC